MCESKTVIKTYEVSRPTRAITPSKPRPVEKPIPVNIPKKQPVSVPR